MLLNMLRMTFRINFFFFFYLHFCVRSFYYLALFHTHFCTVVSSFNVCFRPTHSHAPHYQLKFLHKRHQQLFLNDLHIWKSQSLNRETRVTLFTLVDAGFPYNFSIHSVNDECVCVCVYVSHFCILHSNRYVRFSLHEWNLMCMRQARNSKQLTKT